MTTFDIQRKLRMAKALHEKDFDAIRVELLQGPLVLKVPKMVDGQAAPNSAAALAEQTIVATSMSDDFTIQQVLRNFGIERNTVTFGLPSDASEAQEMQDAVTDFAAEMQYEGEVRWDENRPDLL